MINIFETDGATLPLFFRRYIVRNYPPVVIELIDRGGEFHDALTYKYPRTATHNRRRFVKLLTRYSVPAELIKMINAGLWIYDHCPKWIQQKLQNTSQ